MSKVTIVSTPYITLEYLPEKKLIYHTVHQPIGVEQAHILKDVLNAGTDALQKYGSCKWLSDDRKNGPLPPEVLEWGEADWNPRTVKAGWKYWANVVPEQIVAAGTLMPVIENLYKLGLQMRVFVNVEEAMAWLDDMPNS